MSEVQQSRHEFLALYSAIYGISPDIDLEGWSLVQLQLNIQYMHAELQVRTAVQHRDQILAEIRKLENQTESRS